MGCPVKFQFQEKNPLFKFYIKYYMRYTNAKKCIHYYLKFLFIGHLLFYLEALGRGIHTDGWRKKKLFKKAAIISETKVSRLRSSVQTSTHWGILRATWITMLKLFPRIGIGKQDFAWKEELGVEGERRGTWVLVIEYGECPWCRTWAMRKTGTPGIHTPRLTCRLATEITQETMQKVLRQESNRGYGNEV